MKEAGTGHWFPPNTGATNESGFTAIPGGYRIDGGVFSGRGNGADFWSSTEYYSYYAWSRDLDYDNSEVDRHYAYKQDGFSVRCVRD